MIPAHFSTRLLYGYKQAGRNDLDFADMLEKFDKKFSNVLDFQKAQPHEVGNFFKLFVEQQPKSVEQKPANGEQKRANEQTELDYFVCSNCSRKFTNVKALNGHKRVCKK